jgi:hypothetical protein
LRCQLDSLRTNVAAKKAPAASQEEKLLALHEKHSEFMDLDAERPALGTHKFGSVPGYVATYREEKWLYLKAKQLDSIMGTGAEASDLKRRHDQGPCDRNRT